MRFFLFLLIPTALHLAACSDNTKNAPLEGKRISILELQSALAADEAGKDTPITIPNTWLNQFWPQNGGYPNHSMQNLALGADLKLAWKANIGRGATRKIPLTAQPVIVDGVIYTLNTRAEVRAFDQSGKMLWETDVTPEHEDEAVLTGGLAYSNQRIYVTNGYNQLVALNNENGEIVWMKKLPSASQAAPTVLDNRIYIMTVDNKLVVLAESDGTQLWEYTGISEGTGLIGTASPAANREVVVPVFSSGEVTALRVENGSLAWSESLGSLQSFGGLSSLSDIKALPVIDKGLLITMNFSGRLAAIDIRSGTRIWEREIGGSNTPWVAGETIYIISSDNHLIAVNRPNGLVHWVKKLPAYENQEKMKNPIQWQGPVMAGNRLLMIASNGLTLEANPLTGEITKEWEMRGQISIPPILAGQTLYVLAQDGTLYAYQ
jgi:outer membrane protein assembly factor BamB